MVGSPRGVSLHTPHAHDGKGVCGHPGGFHIEPCLSTVRVDLQRRVQTPLSLRPPGWSRLGSQGAASHRGQRLGLE